MEWWIILLALIGSLIVIMLSGMPVAFVFAFINVVGVFIFWGGTIGIAQLIHSMFASVTIFALIPVPLFILMGELLFNSGIATDMIDALDKWVGRLPGRLSLLAVVAGVLIGALSGAGMAATALLGALLVPEMEKRGYKKSMTLGPIMGSGGLAVIIPPSGWAVLLAGVALISVGKLLIAGIIPGLVLAAIYGAYIIIRSWLQPSIAPPYEAPPVPIFEKLVATVKYILPLGLIVFLVVGLIFLGIAAPSEAAALGCVGAVILAAFRRRVNWQMMKKSLMGTTTITVMIFAVALGCQAFAQILAFTGATRGLGEFVVGLSLSPIMVVIGMQAVLVILGMFVDGLSMILITVPIFYPIILQLGFDPIWFGLLMILNIDLGTKTPPVGSLLFIMKGVAPPGTTMGDIIRAAFPFVLLQFVGMGLVLFFPSLALWLPGIMRG